MNETDYSEKYRAISHLEEKYLSLYLETVEAKIRLLEIQNSEETPKSYNIDCSFLVHEWTPNFVYVGTCVSVTQRGSTKTAVVGLKGVSIATAQRSR